MEKEIRAVVNAWKAANNGIFWLGYGYKKSGNTFPASNPASWERAKEEHATFKTYKYPENKADFAVIRPYTARSVRGIDHFTADRFLTDYLLETAVFDFELIQVLRLALVNLLHFLIILRLKFVYSQSFHWY